MHWVQTSIIYPAAGGFLEMTEDGVWNLNTFKFRTNGWVTDTSSEYEHMIGAKVHSVGYTSEFPPPTPETPVTTKFDLRFN